MRRGGLAAARARAQAGLLLAMCGIVVAATFALIGLDAWHRSAEREAVDAALRTGPATSAALIVRADADGEGDLEDRLRALPVEVVRNLQIGDLPARHADTTTNVTARADAGLESRAELVDGQWPTNGSGTEIHGSLQHTAATTLDIQIGDHLTVGSRGRTVDVVVDGTWRPDDPAATAWAGDPSVGSGQGPDGSGPLVVPASDLKRLPGTAIATYILTPRSSTDLPRLSRALQKVTDSLDDSDAVSVTGGLPQRLADVETTRGAGQGLLTVAYTLVGLAAFVACQQVISLLVAARRTETTLLRSRGATVLALVRVAMVESAVAAAVGAASGAVAGITVFTALDRRPDTMTAVVIAGACALVTVVLAGAATWSTTRTAGLRRNQGGLDGRGVRGIVLVLTLAVAALSVGQFLAYDGPLTRTSSGEARIDPITSIAPAAALAALTLLGAALAGPLIRPLERLAARRSALAPALPVRQLARALSTFGVATVLVSLATGFAIVAATVAGTQSSLDDRAAGMRSGADVRLDLTVGHDAEVGAEAATRPFIDLGDRALAAMSVPGRVGDDVVPFLAAPTSLPDVAVAALESADSDEITRLLDPDETPGVAIDAGRLDVQISLDGTITEGKVSTELWLVDDAGQVAVLPAAPIDFTQVRSGAVARTFVVPANPRGWRLVAVTGTAPGIDGEATMTVSGPPGADQYDVTLKNGLTEGRAVVGTPPEALRVVITPAFAALIDAQRGDTFDLLLPDSGFHATVTVAGIVPGIPGVADPRGISADLPTFVAYALAQGQDVPAPNSVWVTTHEVDRVVHEAQSSSVVPVAATTSAPSAGSRIVASAVDASWWAAGAVIVFAALGAAAMATSLARARRGERQVLRALGLAPAWQSRIAAGEFAGAISVGLVLGLVTGGITSVLTVPDLTRSATPGLPAAVEPDLSPLVVPPAVAPGLLVLIAFLAACLIAVMATYARHVRRAAGRTTGQQMLP